MFAIYTPNGRSFYGPLEELRRVEKSQLINSTRKQHEIDDTLPFANRDYALPPKAIDAYRDDINQPETRDLVLHAYQIMTSPVQVINANDTLATVIKKFKQLPYQEFPVINTQQQLLGSISRQQIYEYILKNDPTYNIAVQSQSVTTLFLNKQSKIYTAEPVTDIRRIATLQVEHHFNTIPILENNGKIVGIVSRTDIIKAITVDPPLSLWC